MSSQIVRVDALRSKAAVSITGTYSTLGTVFAHPMRLICLSNNTDGDLTFSFDGTTDNLFIPAGGFKLFDLTTNRTDPDQSFVFATGTQVYVKGTPTLRSVYLEAIYGQGE